MYGVFICIQTALFMCVDEHELGLCSWQVELEWGITHSTTTALAVNQPVVTSCLLSLHTFMISVCSTHVLPCYCVCMHYRRFLRTCLRESGVGWESKSIILLGPLDSLLAVTTCVQVNRGDLVVEQWFQFDSVLSNRVEPLLDRGGNFSY